MKAAVCERYGPPEVVQIREVPTPVPADNEVLVKGAATTVNSGDARLRALRVPRGMSLPVRLTHRLQEAEAARLRVRHGGTGRGGGQRGHALPAG